MYYCCEWIKTFVVLDNFKGIEPLVRLSTHPQPGILFLWSCSTGHRRCGTERDACAPNECIIPCRIFHVESPCRLATVWKPWLLATYSLSLRDRSPETLSPVWKGPNSQCLSTRQSTCLHFRKLKATQNGIISLDKLKFVQRTFLKPWHFPFRTSWLMFFGFFHPLHPDARVSAPADRTVSPNPYILTICCNFAILFGAI